jgi:uncharacterized cupin superfamily protein
MKTNHVDEPFVTMAEVDEGWEHDEETGGLVRMLRADEHTQIGLWKPGPVAGTAIVFEPPVSETFVVLSGTGQLEIENGGVLELRPGVIVSLPRGLRTRWVVDEDFEELWVYS